MKLYKLLFENINEDDVIKAIFNMLGTSSRTARYIKSIGSNKNIMDLAKSFYDQNKTEWNKILSNATSIEHLGGGTMGNAFNVGTEDKNYILKLEVEDDWDSDFSSKSRATVASTALFSTPKARKTQKTKIAAAVPMIYDEGSMTFREKDTKEIDLKEVSWTLMEKFETEPIEGTAQYVLNDLISYIVDELYNGSSLKDIKNNIKTDDLLKSYIKRLGSSLRLKDNWFSKLVTHMQILKKAGIEDFHAGNVGIRRSGGEGTLVFFD